MVLPFDWSPEERQQAGVVNKFHQMNLFLEPINLWNLLDLANLESLCVIARFPRFHHSANEYFRAHYRGKQFGLSENYQPADKYLIHFMHSIQQVRLCGMDESTFENVALNCPTLAKITFQNLLNQNVNVPMERADILRNTMQSVQTVVFNVHRFDGAVFDRLLHHAMNNIRVLIINSTSTKPKQGMDVTAWYSQRYPSLGTVQWDDGIISNPLGFRRLLSSNQNISHLIFSRNICAAIDFLKKFKINLLRLDATITSPEVPKIKSICNSLIQLFENGRYRQLHVTCNDSTIFDQLKTVQGLKGITFNGKYFPAIGEMMELTHLSVDSMDVGLIDGNQLIKLHNFHINTASIDAIAPLIREAPQIEKIVIKNVDDSESLDYSQFRNLVEQRKQLSNAKRLKLYLEERAYCVLKAHETVDSAEFVIIRRVDELI